MMPMLRFFRHGDGSFALFNGMSSAPSDLVATLLAYDDTHGVPMANMPHTGFQRLDAARRPSSWTPAAAAAERQPDAQPAAFVRIVFRSEPDRHQLRHAEDRPRQLAPFARSTAAHSTLTYNDTSSCQFVELSAVKRLLQGAPIIGGPFNVESYREAVPTPTS